MGTLVLNGHDISNKTKELDTDMVKIEIRIYAHNDDESKLPHKIMDDVNKTKSLTFSYSEIGDYISGTAKDCSAYVASTNGNTNLFANNDYKCAAWFIFFGNIVPSRITVSRTKHKNVPSSTVM